MSLINRREFLRLAGASSAVMLGARSALAGEGPASADPFRILVVGDSLIWGQGLPEERKTYAHVTDWLRREHFAGARKVELLVKAHSGATIRLESKESKLVRAAGDEDRTFSGEVNLAYPSMWKQVELAAGEYKGSANMRGADLVLVTAGITDLTVEGVLNPFEDSRKLVEPIRSTCYDRVNTLLEHIAANNPAAIIAVIGYYPIVSPLSSRRRVLNGWLDVLNVPPFLQPMVNNPLVRATFFRRLLKNAIKRSRVWVEESNRNFRLAVEAHNTRGGKAIFIPSPLTEENAVEAPGTMLFRMTMNGRVEDALYEQRSSQCKAAFRDLRATTGEKHSPHRCSVAAVGHPDQRGARLYADAVIAELKTLIPA